MKSREKDQKLANACRQLSDAATEALAWADDNTELLGGHHKDMVRTLKKQAVEARKLARAASRPMSVGVFGPSQHGKSFLSGRFLKPADPEEAEKFGRVRFGSGPQAISLDFLKEVNPQGGRETTGLVTRFTLNEIECPPNYPVCLRIMSEIDIVKILANSFVHDLSCDAVNTLDHSYIGSLLDSFESKLGDFSDNLIAEDIYELEDYFQQSLSKRHPIKGDLGAYFWSRADRILPALPAPDRARLFALLWGETPEFTELYSELKAALDTLGHPDTAFVSLDAIRNLLPGETILHVETMKIGLGTAGGAMETVVTRDGRNANLRKPVITALTLEISAQLEQAPWDFFLTTDLLDFPGCRTRHDKNREQFFNDRDEKHPIGEAFLRGKVAVLFDNYASDYDLNSLVACHQPKQFDANFRELVDAWIKRTHGATPEERAGRPVTLFFAVTWSDSLLDVAEGMASIELKISNSLDMLNNMNAITEWEPNKPFNNTFLIRSPSGRKLPEFFEIKDIPPSAWQEIRQRPEKAGLLNEYRRAFGATQIGQRHFGDTDSKWDAMITANDGGTSLLARSLDETMDPDIKYSQIVTRESALRATLSGALEVYYESGDLAERVRQRLAVIQEVVDVLRPRMDLVPRFITEFQLGTDMVRRTYLDFRQQTRGGTAASATIDMTFGEVVLNAWADTMFRRHESDALCHAYGLESHLMQRVTEELERGARLASAVEVIDDRVSEIENFSQDSGKNADRVAIIVSLLLGEFVSSLGCRGGIRLPSLPEASLFQTDGQFDTDGLPVFAARRDDMAPIRNRFMSDWLTALLFLTELNASSSEGSLVNIAENARLGDIIASIGTVS